MGVVRLVMGLVLAFGVMAVAEADGPLPEVWGREMPFPAEINDRMRVSEPAINDAGQVLIPYRTTLGRGTPEETTLHVLYDFFAGEEFREWVTRKAERLSEGVPARRFLERHGYRFLTEVIALGQIGFDGGIAVVADGDANEAPSRKSPGEPTQTLGRRSGPMGQEDDGPLLAFAIEMRVPGNPAHGERLISGLTNKHFGRGRRWVGGVPSRPDQRSRPVRAPTGSGVIFGAPLGVTGFVHASCSVREPNYTRDWRRPLGCVVHPPA